MMVERKEYEDAPGPLVRLQKLLAMAGVDSRRHCEEYIVTGRVTVDGKTVSELGVRVDPRRQDVRLDGERVIVERKVYYVLNKPPGFLCTNRDPAGRSRAIDLFPKGEKRLFTVGRLDEDSQGLLLVTNDGEMAHRLAHPRFRVTKVYRVQVAGVPTREMLGQLKSGMQFAEGKFRVNDARLLRTKGESALVELTLTEGQNREIRRLLARLGHKVLRLERVALGPLTLGTLPLGRYRPVTPDELQGLRTLVSGRAVSGQEGSVAAKSRRRERDGLVDSRAPRSRKRRGKRVASTDAKQGGRRGRGRPR